MPINLSEEFLKHALECKLMAKFATGSENKTAWTRMAERWQRCAELFESQALTASHQATQRHPLRWAHH